MCFSTLDSNIYLFFDIKLLFKWFYVFLLKEKQITLSLYSGEFSYEEKQCSGPTKWNLIMLMKTSFFRESFEKKITFCDSQIFFFIPEGFLKIFLNQLGAITDSPKLKLHVLTILFIPQGLVAFESEVLNESINEAIN